MSECSKDPGATHYEGCPCHEARHKAELASLEKRVFEMQEAVVNFLIKNRQREAKAARLAEAVRNYRIEVLDGDKDGQQRAFKIMGTALIELEKP